MKVDLALEDLLRSHGATDDDLKHLRNTAEVKHLLETLHHETLHHEYDAMCVECGEVFTCDGLTGAHLRDCKTADAMRTLGFECMKYELENAEDEARREHERRADDARRAARRAGGRITIAADANVPDGTVYVLNNFLREVYSPEALQQALMTDNPLTTAARGGLSLMNPPPRDAGPGWLSRMEQRANEAVPRLPQTPAGRVLMLTDDMEEGDET